MHALQIVHASVMPNHNVGYGYRLHIKKKEWSQILNLMQK